MVPLDTLGDGAFKVSGGFSSQKDIPSTKHRSNSLGSHLWLILPFFASVC